MTTLRITTGMAKLQMPGVLFHGLFFFFPNFLFDFFVCLFLLFFGARHVCQVMSI